MYLVVFTKKSLQFLVQASKNQDSLAWFDGQKDFYKEHLVRPMSQLSATILSRYKSETNGIDPNTVSISRPKWPKHKHKKNGIYKLTSHFNLSEKKTSLYEMNPCIYFQVSARTNSAYLGVGLYSVSSRQMKLLRQAFDEDFNYIDHILSEKEYRTIWGELLGDQFKVYPRTARKEQEANPYMWFKQFYLAKEYTLDELYNLNFENIVCHDLKSAIPFFVWLRAVVGTFKRKVSYDY